MRHKNGGVPASVFVVVFVCSSGATLGRCAAATPSAYFVGSGGAGGFLPGLSVARLGVCLGSKSRKFVQGEPWEYAQRREFERRWFERARGWRREQCEPYIEAIDRRWERRAGGMALDAIAWAEAREAEAQLRRAVERDQVLRALEREASDRALFDRVRFGFLRGGGRGKTSRLQGACQGLCPGA
jgi:hypothetical protein